MTRLKLDDAKNSKLKIDDRGHRILPDIMGGSGLRLRNAAVLDTIEPFASSVWDFGIIYSTLGIFNNHYNAKSKCPKFYIYHGAIYKHEEYNCDYSCIGRMFEHMTEEEQQQFVKNFEMISKLISSSPN